MKPWKHLSLKTVVSLHRAQRLALYLLAGAVLLVLGGSAWVLIHHADDGLSYSLRSGQVLAVRPRGPADGRIASGDLIYFIDGEPLPLLRRLEFPRAGDQVTYLVFGLGAQPEPYAYPDYFQVKLTLAPPAPALVLERLSPLLSGLCFWLVGLLALALGRAEGRVDAFFMFCQVTAAVLGLGALSAVGFAGIARAFAFLLPWAGALAVHVQGAFSFPHGRWRRWLPWLYLPVAGLSLSLMLAPRPAAASAFAPWQMTLWLSACLLAALLLPFVAIWKGGSPQSRRELGVLAAAGLAAFLPFGLFSLLPEMFTSRPALPYALTLLALPALPLGYGYAILRFRLVRVEKWLNRSAAAALAAGLVAAAYAAIFLALPQLLPGKDRRLTALGLAAMTGLIFLAHPLYRACLRLVNRLFYGGWVDDQGAVRQVSQALTQAEGDTGSIAVTLCRTLVKTMQLEYASLLLQDGSLAAAGGPRGTAPRLFHALDAAAAADALQALFASGQEIGAPLEIESRLPLAEDVRRQILGGRPQLCLLLRGSLGPLGLLTLGSRRGGELERGDLETLEVVVRQASAALENAALLQEVRRRAGEVRQLHRQALLSREAERKRVARELHDRTIQALVGLNYGLARAHSQPSGQMAAEIVRLQGEVRAMLDDVRQICVDLRPPALDTLGLIPVLQARAAEIEAETGLKVLVRVAGDEEQEIPEAAGLCLYRVFQEALANAWKHAGACTVVVEVQVKPDAAALLVQDDGRGCALPASLGELAHRQHFGLVGLQEWVGAAQGSFAVWSAPGQGFRLEARVPFAAPAEALE